MRIRQLAALAALLMLSACGFQLRGAAPVSAALQPLAVECTTRIPETLCQAVREQLRLGGIESSPPEAAAYRLKLSQFKETRRASAVTLQGAAAEYDIRQSVGIQVITREQIPLVALTDVHSSESYRYDESSVLAKQREERAIRETLHQRLAQQIIFRLAPLSAERIQAILERSTAAEPEASPGP
ncbi:LPS assembly lipoprotein LptE [Marinobacter sp. X15-166B]|uniref:LPS-assembly lipoprotein LptE n=1 Tax=Marinobacter sp. X15-166B TaxID=1897620 RepID=UPI00085C23F8|nr:LPS assembly lipoprotein LptE [Marinobacter sp. X15-166B]OEY65226.1 hypothetical protein BG841_01270 [Marinobacter sp. X15-166B]